MNEPKVFIIILNWNGLEDTIKCLESLKKITYSNYEVIIVDNGSHGDDADILDRNYREYIKLIRNAENTGFTGGNNLAIKWLLQNSNPDYFLLLNNDTVVHPELLTEIVKVAENDLQIGIVGPKTYVLDLPEIIQTVWVDLDMYRGRATLAGLLDTDKGQYNEIRSVDCVQGSCLLIKKKVIEQVGLLDEDYFCYWEETDYCLRTRKAGYKIYYSPKAVIWHKNTVTVGLEPWYKTILSRERDSLSISKTYYMTRNTYRFMKKNASRREYLSFISYFFCYWSWYRSAVILLYYRQISVLGAFIKGTWDGLLI